MKCPHCTVEIHPAYVESFISSDEGRGGRTGGYWWRTSSMECPSCKQAIIYLCGNNQSGESIIKPMLVFPRGAARPKPANEVPAHIAEDFHEACLVVNDSPKASAALSRRCLQTVLRENGFPQKDLAPAIQAALDSGKLPSAIADNVDAIRNIGNFAAHPMKDTSTGQILPVEPHEAEWNLDVLEELFDFFYVQPEKARQRRAALDTKLALAGKPPMK